ncbi:MAG: hypothetical protein LW855_01885 [Alphaproteobacteria bacterium]|jgi:hypothetical protein|nr:hypothetical protein [Alphaproteobacteria bacterium]
METQSKLDANFDAFKKLLPELLEKHSGKFAVMHECKLQEVFDTPADAYKYAQKLYKKGDYAIQEIGAKPINLGFYNHALLVHPV